MQPRYRALHHPTINSQPAAVFGSTTRNPRLDSPSTQFLTMRIGMIGAIAIKLVRSLSGTSDLAADRRNLVNQGQQLFDIMNVCRGGRGGQRNSFPVRAHVMLTSRFAAIRRVGPCFFASSEGSDRTAVEGSTRPVDLVGLTQFGQQNTMQLLPHACVLPSLQIVPAGHSRTTAHFLGQIFPGDA